MSEKTRRYLISGKVQGVHYRASTEARAQELGVKGWTRNLTDGRVEVLASGSQQQLAALADWLEQGPERARVDEVLVSDEPEQLFLGFTIEATAPAAV
ncbi:acylphosphatase [Gilvimarinus algae]|uniref:acylphosphatase n=1 Tax=Gilvimarinus algae TaxID=3058037 RepID=A0ABT8TCE8_9GAMM|nr:acylphosphatase [Gilvimarinus sp. SDUM040014]MDO3381782.1 acylphosphatase [Gilvimarinus sp. SDUM040014]